MTTLILSNSDLLGLVRTTLTLRLTLSQTLPYLPGTFKEQEPRGQG